MRLDDTPRDSRAGDQFHYLWAARRCLRLLAPGENLVAVTVEGGSLDEDAPSAPVGEHVIDVGEYYGSEVLRDAERVRYLQLKHSVRRQGQDWKPSELKGTLSAFAAKFAAVPAGVAADRLTFEFVSNRPVPDAIRQVVDQLGRGETAANPALASKLIGYTGLDEPRARAFYARVRFQTDEPDFITQRILLNQDAAAVLNEADRNAPIILKDLVASIASGEIKDKRSIRKPDVLLRWGVREKDLLPAPSRIEPIAHQVTRAQYADLAADVVKADQPVLIHAPAGVGKTVFTLCLGELMPAGSVTLTYDCYGGGKDDNYRQRSKSRHLPEDAFVQMANELAGQGLCAPLIPIGSTSKKSLLRAFWSRLSQAAEVVRAQSPDALVCLVFDAVDNAEMAALEFQDGHSFAYDLLRETPPEGVRIVTLCRPERRRLLSPPSKVIQRPLRPFDLSETRAHLDTRFPSATDQDAGEFHRLSSRNPRVQANALAVKRPLHEILAALGPDPTDVDAIISRQLEDALAFQKDHAGHDPLALDRLCSAIAVLRPLIPISFLADLSGLTTEAIISFATEFAGGRPLMVVEEAALQFRDEPVEDWFRRRYRPTAAALQPFIDILKPHAATSAYVASNLPGLMLEADQFDELVEMTLKATGLPSAKGSQKREIDVQRLTFALRAAIRLKRWPEAIKLALRAGEENAGEKREQELHQDQYDLTTRFVEPELIQDAVAKRRVSSKWNGARYAYEAAVLSGAPALRPEARSRLRMSDGWIRAHLDLPDDDRKREDLKVVDLCPRVFARFNIAGAAGATAEIMRWGPASVRLELARTFARILIDHGRGADLDAILTLAAERRYGPILAGGIEELAAVGQWPSLDIARRAWSLGLGEKAIPRDPEGWGQDRAVASVLAVAEAAVFHGVAPLAEIATRLRRRFPGKPDPSIGSRFGAGSEPGLRLHSLRAALEGRELQPFDVAPERLRKQWTPKVAYSGESSDVREFKRKVGAVLPWWNLRALQIVAAARGEALELGPLIESVRETSTKNKDHYEEVGYDIDDQIAVLWFDILCRGRHLAGLSEFQAWHTTKGRPLFAKTHTRLARRAARTAGFEPLAFDYAKEAAEAFAQDHLSTAEARLTANVDICRALLAHSPEEAAAYFAEASEMAVHVGDEAFSRWSALTALADAAEGAPASDADRQAVAGNFARCAEFAQDHLDRHFSDKAAIRNLVALSPNGAVALLSRWMDRDVGYLGSQLPSLIQALLDRRAIDGSLASAFLGFHGEWDYGRMVRAADQDATGVARDRLLSDLLHYLPLAPVSVRDWEEMVGCFTESPAFTRMVLGGLSEGRKAARIAARQDRYRYTLSKPSAAAWNKVFAGLDLGTAAGLAEARARSQGDKGPRNSDEFWRQAIGRIPPGREAALIRSALEIETGALDVRAILAEIPAAWLTRKAPRLALADLVDTVVRQEWRYVRRVDHWALLSVEQMLRTTDLTRQQIFQAAVEGAAASGEFGGPDQIFGLVDLMADLVSPAEALDSLEFGLDRMTGSIPETFGEVWTPDRTAPSSIDACLAGLLFVALGSPIAGRRWEAAHVVRALFGRSAASCIGQIAALEAGLSPDRFVSVDLPFYDLHARLWWMYAVASAAVRTPDAVWPIFARLRALAVRSNPHLIIRELAARALLALEADRPGTLSVVEQADLLLINQSRLPPIIADSSADPYGPGRSTLRFYISYEFGKSDLTSLAGRFPATRADITGAMEDLLLDEWGVGFDGSWKAEPRRHHSALREGRRMRSGEDAAHSYSDYLVMHGAITIGGRWLEGQPTRKSPHYDDGTVASWCARYLPTRDDGAWISDLRGPPPSVKRLADQDKLWRWSVRKQELIAVTSGPELPLWGSWSDRQGQYEENVHVRSALIRKGPPMALLAAAQTAGEPWDCPLPLSGEDREVAEAGFELKGWIEDDHPDTNADRNDPWAADMSYPPPAPAFWAVRKLGLHAVDHGSHFLDRRSRRIFRSEVWSTASGHEGEQVGPRGYRLTVSKRQAGRQLRRLKADLLISISIQRERRRHDSSRELSDDEIGPINPYFLHVLVTRDGQLRTL